MQNLFYLPSFVLRPDHKQPKLFKQNSPYKNSVAISRQQVSDRIFTLITSTPLTSNPQTSIPFLYRIRDASLYLLSVRITLATAAISVELSPSPERRALRTNSSQPIGRRRPMVFCGETVTPDHPFSLVFRGF